MKIAISRLPKNRWWGNGIISYKDNPVMKDGTIPNQDLLFKERTNLINTIKNNKFDVVEFPFPKELENTKNRIKDLETDLSRLKTKQNNILPFMNFYGGKELASDQEAA